MPARDWGDLYRLQSLAHDWSRGQKSEQQNNALRYKQQRSCDYLGPVNMIEPTRGEGLLLG